MLKALAILADTTVRRSAVDQEDLNHTGNQKKDHFSCPLVNNPIIQKFFPRLS